jgi:hypothetical protein
LDVEIKIYQTLIFFLCSLPTCWLKVFNDCHIWSLHNLTESPGWLSLLKKVRQKVQLKQDVKLRLEWWGWLRKLLKWTFQDRRWNRSSDVEVGVVSKFWLPICDLAMGWRTNWIKKCTGNVVFTENVEMYDYQLQFFYVFVVQEVKSWQTIWYDYEIFWVKLIFQQVPNTFGFPVVFYFTSVFCNVAGKSIFFWLSVVVKKNPLSEKEFLGTQS